MVMLDICGEAYKQIPTTMLVNAMLPDPDSINSILEPYMQPWYDSIENPQKAQEQVLSDLLHKYASTEYGANTQRRQIKQHFGLSGEFPHNQLYRTCPVPPSGQRTQATRRFCLNRPKPGL